MVKAERLVLSASNFFNFIKFFIISIQKKSIRIIAVGSSDKFVDRNIQRIPMTRATFMSAV